MEAVVATQRPAISGAAARRSVDPEPGAAPAPQPPADPGAAAPGEPPRSGLRAVPWVVSTYFAEGLPYTIVHKVAAELFTSAGASLSDIGLASVFHLPWNLKFTWSPLVDVYGTSRRWIVATEVVLALVVLALAWPAQQGALRAAAVGFVALAFVAATHDIAIDGFYLGALDKNAQTSLSGVRVGAYRVALLAGGLLVALAGYASWRTSFLVAGAALGLLAAAHAVFLPGARPRPPAAARPAGGRLAEIVTTFLGQPGIGPILAFVVLYRAGDAMMFAMHSPLLKDLGLDTTARGLVASVGTVASIAGSMLGAFAISRRGLARTIFPIAILQSLAIPLYVALAWLRPARPWVVALVTLEQLAAGIGTAVLMVFLMRRCAEPYKASHFAIGSALMSVAATAAGGVSGYIADAVGFPVFFTIAFAASIPGVILARFVPAD